MVEWKLQFSKKAEKDVNLLKAVHLSEKAKAILSKIKEDPYGTPPPFEKLKADLNGKYSRRINIKHRIVYSVDASNNEIIIYGMFSHYGE